MTDVDDTLLGDDPALEELVAAADAHRLLIVLNSSRPIASVQRSLAQLPVSWRPHGIIGALGTQIELDERRLLAWERRFTAWERRPIDAAMQRAGFLPHPAEYQARHKASYTVPAHRVEDARHAVSGSGVVSKVIMSGESSFDVIPPNAGKSEATRYVAAQLRVPLERTATAGDSANDADLVRTGRGIVVGNGSERLRRAVHGCEVYLATRAHAGGILEGLDRLGAIGAREGS